MITSDIKEILFLKGVVNYTEFHFRDGSKKMTCLTLKRCEEQLPSFVRINRSYLINPGIITQIYSEGVSRFVRLNSGQVFSVSRRRKRVLDLALNKGRKLI